jgi:hypothetical protein
VTPNFAIVHVHNPHWRGFRLWIPLCLLWIPIILLSPLLLLIALAVCFLWRINFWNSLSVFWGILSALPGIDVRVQAQQNQVLVKVF